MTSQSYSMEFSMDWLAANSLILECTTRLWTRAGGGSWGAGDVTSVNTFSLDLWIILKDFLYTLTAP